jgi:hypothetical protein
MAGPLKAHLLRAFLFGRHPKYGRFTFVPLVLDVGYGTRAEGPGQSVTMFVAG